MSKFQDESSEEIMILTQEAYKLAATAFHFDKMQNFVGACDYYDKCILNMDEVLNKLNPESAEWKRLYEIRSKYDDRMEVLRENDTANSFSLTSLAVGKTETKPSNTVRLPRSRRRLSEAETDFKDISWNESAEDLKRYKKDQEIEALVIESDREKEKIRLSIKKMLPDPLDYFKDKKEKDIITVIVLEALDNGINVSPEGCSIKIFIKKNQIAVEKEDQRTNRFKKGDKVDCLLQSIDLNNRTVTLSIKMLEEKLNKEAIKKWGSTDSGKSLPFADLTSALEKKRGKKQEEK